ncbi:MAG: AEC family transporter [Haloferacaceae archaeon]
MTLVSALTTAVLPILSISVVGYAFGLRFDVDVDPLNAVTLYVLLPALVFHSLAITTLGGATVVRIGVAVVAFVAAMVLLSEAVGRVAGVEEPYLSALVLTATFPNSGNFGIPLSDFAFGAAGRTAAVVFLTVQNVLVYVVGVYIASRGAGHEGASALREVFRLPLIYAAVAALVARWAGVLPPAGSAAMRTVGLVGDASIPLMLLVLGIQLAGIDVRSASRTVVPSTLKLIVAPAVGAAIVLALGFSDATAARVVVLETATPAAVLPLMLTIEYSDPDADGLTAPEYVSAVIFVTTLLSVLTLTVLIGLLRSGMLV